MCESLFQIEFATSGHRFDCDTTLMRPLLELAADSRERSLADARETTATPVFELGPAQYGAL